MELWLRRYRSRPVPAVTREVTSVLPDFDDSSAPVLCVTGEPTGAGAFGEHWLSHFAERGRGAYAVSVRGQGGTAKVEGGQQGRVHDLVQEAVRLPRRAVLMGHGRGAGLVAHAATRYPAAAVVLLAPRGLKAAPGKPLGNPRVLVAGSPDDGKSPSKVLDTVASAYGGAPLLFPGMSHDFMNDANWKAGLDAILDWLDDKDG